MKKTSYLNLIQNLKFIRGNIKNKIKKFEFFREYTTIKTFLVNNEQNNISLKIFQKYYFFLIFLSKLG